MLIMNLFCSFYFTLGETKKDSGQRERERGRDKGGNKSP
jgi:hypothetical protein